MYLEIVNYHHLKIKKVVEQISTPETLVATIKKAESKPRAKKVVENIIHHNLILMVLVI